MRQRLLFLTVMPSPYQRQLLAALAAEPDLAVTVRYFTAGAHDRQWALPDLHPHERVMAGRTLARLGPSAHWNPGVLGAIAAAAPDLTVVSDYSAPTAQLAMRALARRGNPFVFWGEVPGFSRRGPLGRFVRRRLQAPLAAAAAVAAIGSRAAAAYRALLPEVPVVDIPYFCDLAPFRAARAAAPPRPPDTVDVLFSGQLIARKGVDVLLDAFCRVAAEAPRLRLSLLGGGPERPRFEASVPPALAGRVAFLGHHEPAALPAAFAAADAFCLPSRHDGWGVVVNEALGAGLPTIVSDAVGAGHDLVRHGGNGLIVPAGDAAALAAALLRIADDTERARMAAAAVAAARRWELSEGVARWRAAADAVLARAGRTAAA